MNRPKSYEELNEAIRRRFGRGMVTNCFLTREDFEAELAGGTLETAETDGALLLYRNRAGFRILNFYLTIGESDPALPELPDGTVLEIPMRQRDDGLRRAADLFRRSGFVDLFTRRRWSRRSGETDSFSPCPEVSPAGEGELAAVSELFARCFDPETGCLPRNLPSKLPGILVYRRAGVPVGLLHHTESRTGSELRHLAVLPELRGQGIAGKLTETYLAAVPGKSTVWVRAGNLPAEAVYRKYGYFPDGTESAVLKKRIPTEFYRK